MKSEKAFTLIELMVVVVIIGILAAIALPNWIRMQTRAQESDVKSVAHTLQLAVEDYKTSPGKEGVKPLNADIAAYVVPCLLPKNVFIKVNPFNRPNTYGAGQIVTVAPTPGQVYYNDNTIANPYSIIAMGKTQLILTLSEGG
jgi:prepilin-type N-terminal cleavage/methylation domain-containing protein